MIRTAILNYIGSSKPITLRRTQRSPKPITVGVQVKTPGINVTVDLTVYENGTYELTSGGVVKYVGAVS